MYNKNMNTSQRQLLKYIIVSSLFAISLGLIRLSFTHHNSYIWLNWNLFLALIPILFAWMATRASSKYIIGFLVLVWLGFLPNAPYLLTDFIHLANVGPKNLLWFDAIMIFSYTIAGLVSWILSFNMLEIHLKWRPWVLWFIAILTGFGIYLGRYIRFNTWDILTKPGEIFETIGNVIISPIVHDPVIAMTSIFAVLLVGLYRYAVPHIHTPRK